VQQRHATNRARADGARAADLKHRFWARATAAQSVLGAPEVLAQRRSRSAATAPQRRRALRQPALAVLREVRPQCRRALEFERLEVPARNGERKVEADDHARIAPDGGQQLIGKGVAIAACFEPNQVVGRPGFGEPDAAPGAVYCARPIDGDEAHDRKLHCDVQSAIQESGWTYLSEEFIQDLERAITEEVTIGSVLKEYGLNRSTYYSWLAIGEGRMTHWRDGTPISSDMRTNCRRLYKRVLRAREARLRTKRQALR